MSIASAAGAQPTPTLDSKALRRTLGCFGTGVTIITTRSAAGEPVGLTVNSFASVSLDPPLVLWSLALDANSLDVFSGAAYFAVNVLASDQTELSNRFASKSADKFDGVAAREHECGVPLLEGCAAWLVCKQEFRNYGGDHVIYIGRVLHHEHTKRPGLLFCGGRYAVAAPIDPSGT